MPAQFAALRRLEIGTIRDLLYHLPARYDAPGEESSTSALIPGSKVVLFGTLSKLKAKKLWKSRRPATEGWFEDSAGRVKCMWFNQPYIASYVQEGSFVKLSGTVGGSPKNPYIANPEFEIIPRGSVSTGMFEKSQISKLTAHSSLFPTYPESRGITSKWFYHAIARVFGAGAHKKMDDPIPRDVRERYHLPDLSAALVWIHTPENANHAEAARKRFSFEEIFIIQVSRAKERARNDAERSFVIHDGEAFAQKFLDSIDFPPTKAQERAVRDILQDFDPPAGESHPMARLLEGDVGAGKTLVAAATAYAVVNSRPPHRESGTLQVAYMAPTEILAMQHFESFIGYFKDLPINIGLIMGSGCKKFPSKSMRGRHTDISRTQLLKWVANGEIAMLVGTHALIQKSVKFQYLAYAIVDEQHRFGVNQRKALIRRSAQTKSSQISADDKPEAGFLYKELSYVIRNAVFAVHNELGSGHKELVYQNALAEEFEKRGITFTREKKIDVRYGTKKVGIYQPDFVIEEKVLVEIKALAFTGTREKTQLWNYLKGSSYRLALLVNFGTKAADITRVVYDTARDNLRSSAGSMRSSAEVVPHFLSMTATPIPRTLALTLYGDLDISVLDELPPGRGAVTTRIVKPERRAEAYEAVRRELRAGRQAFVICPRIEEPDPAKENALQAKSAKAEAKRLKSEVFPEYEIGLLHGSMKSADKDAAMKRFAEGKTQILVATSVIEVGINVPNATVIMIEGAERFGLAQLHQLRGRIQRSTHQPHCFLLPETQGDLAMKRLRALEKSNDGFKLAEADLEARGAGDLFGQRQWGISDIGMEALKNPRLIQAARTEAIRIVGVDASLTAYPELSKRAEAANVELHSE